MVEAPGEEESDDDDDYATSSSSARKKRRLASSSEDENDPEDKSPSPNVVMASSPSGRPIVLRGAGLHSAVSQYNTPTRIEDRSSSSSSSSRTGSHARSRN